MCACCMVPHAVRFQPLDHLPPGFTADLDADVATVWGAHATVAVKGARKCVEGAPVYICCVCFTHTVLPVCLYA